MNKGDLVYIYLFDIKKTIVNMKSFREDRFGVIIDQSIKEVQNTNGKEFEMIYKVKNCNDKIMEYHSNNLSYSIVTIPELINIVDELKINKDEKRALLDQINKAINKFK
jgi:hypothetical protein